VYTCSQLPNHNASLDQSEMMSDINIHEYALLTGCSSNWVLSLSLFFIFIKFHYEYINV